jgi:AraC family transcriptional regulator of adaptative response / DNA-3-methyladenine glycosylase II
MLAFLAPRATPGVEAVEDDRYLRSISVNGNHGYLEVTLDEANGGLAARVQFGDPRSLFFITERIRAMFDLNADWTAIVQSLRSDPALARRIESDPGLRVPGCWNGFELTVRAILGQQVSVRGATTLAGRLVKAFGQPVTATAGITHIFPTPQILANANLSGVGLTGARAETIRALARAVCDGRLSFEGVTDAADFLARLCEIPGIGNWSAQYVAMRALGEPDAFPSSDLGLLRALELTSARELECRAEAWRPWRAYAAVHLWNTAPDAKNPGRKNGYTGGAAEVTTIATPA